jgi:hypothetical protein
MKILDYLFKVYLYYSKERAGIPLFSSCVTTTVIVFVFASQILFYLRVVVEFPLGYNASVIVAWMVLFFIWYGAATEGAIMFYSCRTGIRMRLYKQNERKGGLSF